LKQKGGAMNNRFSIFLNNPSYFRIGFLILLVGGTILNYFLHNNLFILYILATIFLGIGFYNRSVWLLIFLTTLVVICRFLLNPFPGVDYFVYHLLAYLLIMFISLGFMIYYQKIKKGNLELILALVNALDSKDPYTLNHSKNVADYALQIAEKMKLSQRDCDVIHKGGLLHDIGKIGLPDYILTKSGRLTENEYSTTKSHPEIGHDIIKHVELFNGSGILDVVLYHHERYDGTGYPMGLKGEKIPSVARIVAIADAFDAMTSKRIYRDQLDLDYSLNEIRKHKGTQFDPAITDVFLSLFDNKPS
jgi:putative nucleotidyltransferase with HDIG domain